MWGRLVILKFQYTESFYLENLNSSPIVIPKSLQPALLFL